MTSKWQVDLERMRASFGKFTVRFHQLEGDRYTLEITNAPGMKTEQALAFASQAAEALSEAMIAGQNEESEILELKSVLST